MLVRFRDGTVKEMPLDIFRMARLIHMGMGRKDLGFKVELNPNRSHAENKKIARKLQRYVDLLDR